MPLQLAPNFLKIAYGMSARAPIQFCGNLRDRRVWCVIVGHTYLSGRRGRAGCLTVLGEEFGLWICGAA